MSHRSRRTFLVDALVVIAVVAAVAQVWVTLEVRRVYLYELSKIGHATGRNHVAREEPTDEPPLPRPETGVHAD